MLGDELASCLIQTCPTSLPSPVLAVPSVNLLGTTPGGPRRGIRVNAGCGGQNAPDAGQESEGARLATVMQECTVESPGWRLVLGEPTRHGGAVVAIISSHVPEERLKVFRKGAERPVVVLGGG